MAGAKVKLEPGLKGIIQGVGAGPEWVQNHVEAYQVENDDPRIDPGWFHPSSLSQECDASLAFQFLGITPRKNRFPPRTLRIFENGHNRDQAWKRTLGKSKLSVINAEWSWERKCPKCDGYDRDGRHICFPEFRIRGDFDDLIKNPFTDELVIFEFKTKNNALFSALKAPDGDHVIQVQPYTAYFANIGVERAIIQYENKNDQNLKPFYQPFLPDLWRQTVERCMRILDELSSDKQLDRVCKYRPCDWTECPVADFPKMVQAYREKAGLI